MTFASLASSGHMRHDAPMSIRRLLPCGLAALLALFLPGAGKSAECGWEWCACKGELARRLLATPSGSTSADPKYAPDRRIDVSHLKLELEPDFEQRSLTGISTLHFAPVGKALREVELDAVDLTIQEVTSSHEIEGWDNGGSHLTITFSKEVPVGEEGWVEIRYEAFPQHGWYYRTEAMGYPKGDDHFFTQGEPERHSHWFPGYDYPNERFTTEVICSVPAGMIVLSNGALVEEKTEDGLTTFHWKQEKEHVNYLISVVGGYFEKLEDTHGELDLAFYTPPSEFAVAENSFRDTSQILSFFEKEIGVGYPWAKYYNVCVADFLAGGMENTSVTTLTTRTLFSGASENIRTSHRLDAHEVAHQWFGNLVTCKDWSHLWLNEGFATYYTHLYEEEKSGRDAMLYGLYRDATNVLGNSDTKPIVWRGYSDPMQQFDYRAYPKGGWVLHMLRSQVGPELYRECIRTYLERNENQVVVTSDLAEVFEDLTGRSWDRFFDQWVFHGGEPKIKVSYQWDQVRKQAKVRLDQVQKIGGELMLFHLDVPVRFILEDGAIVTRTAKMRSKAEDFYFSLPGKPKIVRIDPDYTLLAEIDFKAPNPLLFAQLENAGDMIGRLFAVKQLGGRKDPASLDRLRGVLQRDPFHGVRIEAAKSLAKSHTPEALERLLASREQDDARVRQEVIRSIGKFYRPQAIEALREVIEGESNPLIVTEALSALGKFPRDEVSETLIAALGRDSYRHAIAVSAIGAIRTQADPTYLDPLQQHLAENEANFDARDFAAGLDALAYLARDSDEAKRESVRKFLARFITSPKEQLRPKAIASLATLGDREAIAPLQTFIEAGDKDSPEYKEAEKAIESLRAEKKQADEVRDLRKEVLSLQRSLQDLQKKVDTLSKQSEAEKE